MVPAEEQEQELSLQDYLYIFLKRKWIIVFSFLVVFSAVFTYTNIQKPIYKASLLFKVELNVPLPSDVVFSASKGYVTSGLSDYVRQVTSRPVLKLGARELGWIKDDMPPEEKEAVVSSLGDKIEAIEVKKSNMILLHAISKDPQQAADIVHKVFEAFKEENIKQKNQQLRSVRVFVEEALEKVSATLEGQEEKLRILTMKGTTGSGTSLIETIDNLEKKRTNLMTIYTEKHPEAISIDREIDELKKKLRNLPKEEFEYGVLKRDTAINEDLYNSLKQKLQEAQIKEAEKIDNVILIDPPVIPEYPFYPNKRKNYIIGIMMGFVFGMTMAFVAEQLDTSIKKIEDIENFLKVSVLGMIPYCAQEDFEKRGWFGRRGRRSTRRPQATLILDDTVDRVFLEAFRILNVNLQMRFGEAGHIKNKVIMLTSCNPRDGKTMITSNLALIMAQMGNRVLLVDTDVRRAQVHKVFGLARRGKGLTNVLMGEADPDSVAITATDLMLRAISSDKVMSNQWLNNLNIITAGSIFPDPAKLFNSDKATKTLEYMKSKYDIVMLDTSPILAVSEPSIIASRVDEILLVFRAGVTSRFSLRMAKNQIESAKGKGSLSGIIINSMTPSIGKYGYYYYGKYGEYYSKKHDMA